MIKSFVGCVSQRTKTVTYPHNGALGNAPYRFMQKLLLSLLLFGTVIHAEEIYATFTVEAQKESKLGRCGAEAQCGYWRQSKQRSNAFGT
ncbi:hypothetical protein KKC13_00950 [bacterium]|nr:hypothetical protein [bacterium]MBU1959358.1 hypothetical protein [bacterium]